MSPDGEVSPVAPRPPGGSSRARWLGVLAGFAVLVGVVVLQRHTGNAPAAAVTSTSPASSTPTGPTPTSSTTTMSTPTGSTSATTAPTTPPVTSTERPATTVATLSPDVIASAPGWEVDAYNDAQGLLRIDMATGRVVQTPYRPSQPGLALTTFLSMPGHTLVSTYGPNGPENLLFPDGGSPITAPGVLAGGSRVLPGPDPSHLWIPQISGLPGAVLVLADWQGRQTGTSIAVPMFLRGYGGFPLSDGAGYVMLSGIGGTYDLRPDSVTLITRGIVLAAGPSGYLAYECGDTPACQTVVIDRATGSRRVIPPVPFGGADLSSAGVITPDGRHAAYPTMVGPESDSYAALVIVDLKTGGTRVVTQPLGGGSSTTGFALSPDGTQLAMLLLGGDIGLVDIATGTVHPLGLTGAVFPVNVLATRVTG